jgi:hypothetical protein
VAIQANEDGEELGGAWQLFSTTNLSDSGSGTASWPTGVPPEALADPDLKAVWVQVYAGPNFDELQPVAGPFPILLK